MNAIRLLIFYPLCDRWILSHMSSIRAQSSDVFISLVALSKIAFLKVYIFFYYYSNLLSTFNVKVFVM